MSEPIVDELLRSPEPSIRWKVRTRVLGEAGDSPAVRRLRREIRRSSRVEALLSKRGADGRISTPSRVYAKWQGAHWVLATLAELGYPAGDKSLAPLAAQVCETWLSRSTLRDRIVAGRHRRCGSIQGNALFAVSRLGLVDDCADRLAALLARWQWPEGGWNCDPRPGASSPSFMETLVPMRALAAYAARGGDQARAAGAAADRAAEVFLERRLFRRRSTGEVIDQEFVTLHYPLYWHYDVWAAWSGSPRPGGSTIRAAPTRSTCWSPSGCRTAAGRPRRATTTGSARIGRPAAPMWTGAAWTSDTRTRGSPPTPWRC